MPSGDVPRSIVVPAICSSRSFSLLKVSQKCSQLIHMRSCFCLASGLETRNRSRNRQEKNEFYFSSRPKIFLTGKWKQTCPRENKKESCYGSVRERRTDAVERRSIPSHRRDVVPPDLTELTRARNFPASRVPLGCRSKCGQRTRR
jgi:hypothetical protein